ncbi:hypothetical protein R6Q57_022343 [Mikania cordata]
MKVTSITLFTVLFMHGNNGTNYVPDNVFVTAIITFGDSLLDSGNNNYLKTLTKANFSPYGKDFVGGKATGRFTNGKTLGDILAKALGVKEYLPAYLDPLIKDNDLLTGVSFASGGTGYDPLTSKLADGYNRGDLIPAILACCLHNLDVAKVVKSS